MTPIANLYFSWLADERLDAGELHRVLDAALTENRYPAVASVLNQRAADDTHFDKVRTSGDPGAIAVWAQHRNTSREDLAEFAKTAELTLACRTVRAAREVPEALLKALWKRRDTELRLAVLSKVRWHHRVPASWSTWLDSARPFEGTFGSERDLISGLAAASAEFMWSYAMSRSDLRVVAWVYAGMNEIRDHQHAAAVELVRETVTQDGDLVAAAELLCEIFTRSPDTTGPGTDTFDLAIAILNSIGDSPERVGLAVKVAYYDDSDTAPEQTREAMLAALASGQLPRTAIEAATHTNIKPNDELWQAVATHPGLTVGDARLMVSCLGWDAGRDATASIVADRDPAWLVELARNLWSANGGYRDSGGNDHLVAVFRAVPHVERDELMCDLVDADVSNLRRLCTLRLASRDAVGRLPVSALARPEEKVTSELLSLTRSRLGADPQRWKLLETLAEGFDGTYGELLDAVLLIDAA